MSYEKKDLTGVLFKNDEKHGEGGDPNWPDYKGNVIINGTDYWLSAWIKTGKASGKKFMSLALKPKEARAARPVSAPSPRTPPEDMFEDSSIPF